MSVRIARPKGRFFWALLAGFVVLASTGPVTASELVRTLSLFREFDVVVNEGDREKAACGLANLAPLRDVARAGMERHGLRFSPHANAAVMVDVSVLRHDGSSICSGVVQVSVHEMVRYKGVRLPVEYYFSRRAFYGQPRDLEEIVTRTVGRLVRDMENHQLTR